MQIDRACADGASAGQADPCLAKSSEQRPEGEYARTHRFDEVIRCLEYLYVLCGDLMRSQLGREDRSTEVFEQATLSYQVFDVRNVVQRYGLGRQQRGRQARKCRILRTADLNAAAKLFSSSN